MDAFVTALKAGRQAISIYSTYFGGAGELLAKTGSGSIRPAMHFSLPDEGKRTIAPSFPGSPLRKNWGAGWKKKKNNGRLRRLEKFTPTGSLGFDFLLGVENVWKRHAGLSFRTFFIALDPLGTTSPSAEPTLGPTIIDPRRVRGRSRTGSGGPAIYKDGPISGNSFSAARRFRPPAEKSIGGSPLIESRPPPLYAEGARLADRIVRHDFRPAVYGKPLMAPRLSRCRLGQRRYRPGCNLTRQNSEDQSM